MFYDPIDEDPDDPTTEGSMFVGGGISGIGSDAEDIFERLSAHHSGGLSEWQYLSPFDPFTIEVDDIDASLFHSFMKETNSILTKVTEEIASMSTNERVTTASDLSYMEVFNAFFARDCDAKDTELCQ